MHAERPLVFLFGTQKSGTTWLRNVVGSHVAIERHAEWYLPALAEGFENQLLRYANHRPEEKLSLLKSNVASAWRQLLTSAQSGSFTDKSAYPCVAETGGRDDLFPYAADMKSFYASDSKRVLIVRDPRDVLVSSKYFFGPGHATLEDDYLSRFVTGWARCNLHWLASGPTAVVRYENLKANFASEISSLFAAIDVELSTSDLEALCNVHQTIDEMQKLDPHFYRKGVVGDWANELSAAQQQLLWKCGGEAMSIFGYEEGKPDAGVKEIGSVLESFEQVPLTWLISQHWNPSGGSARLNGAQIEATVLGDHMDVTMEPTAFPLIPQGKKLLLVLNVSWAQQYLQGDDTAYFNKRLGCSMGPSFGLSIVNCDGGLQSLDRRLFKVYPRSYLYALSSMICFELDASPAAGQLLRISLFNGRFTSPFEVTINALAFKLVDMQCALAEQLGDLESVGLPRN